MARDPYNIFQMEHEFVLKNWPRGQKGSHFYCFSPNFQVFATLKICWKLSCIENEERVHINRTNYKKCLCIPYRGDKTETEVLSGFLKEAKMLDLAYNLGLLFLGEQKLSLEVSEIYKFSSSFNN